MLPTTQRAPGWTPGRPSVPEAGPRPHPSRPACPSGGLQPARQCVARVAAPQEVFREEQRLRGPAAGPPPPHPAGPGLEQVGSRPGHADGVASLGEEQASTSGRAERGEFTPRGRGPVGVSVEVRNLNKVFGPADGAQYVAATDLNLSIPRNSVTALLGPSGSGKTTLLRMISGLESPTSGQILFDGEDVTELSVKERNIGFVFQSYALFRHLTVADNIKFGPRMRKQPIDLDARVRELLELVELEGYGGRLPKQLSGGQRQRIALARALAPEPQLLLLDEPFGALDPTVRAAVRQGFKEIIARVGITAILVTHDQEEAFDTAHQVAIFNKGRIVQVGTPEEVQRAPAGPFVLDFIEDTNHLPASCLFIRKMGFPTGGKRWVMTRPTGIQVFLAQPPSPPTAAATVADVIDVGYAVKYTMRFDDGVNIEVHEEGEEASAEENVLSQQQRVYLHIPAASLMAFEYSELGARPE